MSIPRRYQNSHDRRKWNNDCLRQCVAFITGRKPHRVPHFVRKNPRKWLWPLAQWCTRTGHAYVYIKSGRFILSNHPQVKYWIEIGPTRNSNKIYHAVVSSRDGCGAAFNPGRKLTRVASAIFIYKVAK